MKLPTLLFLGFLAFNETAVRAQPVEQLVTAYSGKTAWQAASATLEFQSSGDINFTNAGVRSFIWQIPPEARKVLIARDVTVNGAFHTATEVTIAGEDRKTSVVYGTEIQSWPQKHGVKAYTICSFQSSGGVMTISNLTSLNPRAFHVRGSGNVAHVSSCDFIDHRGGSGNHSDGFEGGQGSTIHDCYFESGDDIIKVYADLTVTDTTIKMVQNSVPIQLGWGNHSQTIVGNFKNLIVLGEGGRGNEGNAIISGRKGRYDTTINIDGCHIVNPKGTLVSLREDSMTLRGNVTNAYIKLKGYTGGYYEGKDLLTVCGGATTNDSYNCLPLGSPLWDKAKARQP